MLKIVFNSAKRVLNFALGDSYDCTHPYDQEDYEEIEKIENIRNMFKESPEKNISEMGYMLENADKINFYFYTFVLSDLIAEKMVAKDKVFKSIFVDLSYLKDHTRGVGFDFVIPACEEFLVHFDVSTSDSSKLLNKFFEIMPATIKKLTLTICCPDFVYDINLTNFPPTIKTLMLLCNCTSEHEIIEKFRKNGLPESCELVICKRNNL